MFTDHLVNLSNFSKIKKIGEGSFGAVYLVEDKDASRFAAKVTKTDCSTPEELQKFSKEVEISISISHPSVLSSKGVSMTDFDGANFPTILTEFMDNGSLQDFMKRNKLTRTQQHILLLGISCGMNYLHSKSIIHRDLKPGNVLLNLLCHPYITDFGESKRSDLALSEVQMGTYAGSPIYMAPEVSEDDPYTYKADVYSFAILACEVMTMKEPYPGYKTPFRLHQDVVKGKRPNLDGVPGDVAKLITRCWATEPSERPRFSDIYNELKDPRYITIFGSTESDVKNYIEFLEGNGKGAIKMAADKGDSDAMVNYANMLRNGEGVPVNQQEAVKYYKMAIDKGNSDAMNNYGLMLKNGEGVPVNHHEAIKYFKMAIDKGNSDAMKNYGNMLNKGEGVLVNQQEAVKYYKMSADKGNSSGMNNYAMMLNLGCEGVPVNHEEAIKYYKMAIDKGEACAMFNYGNMLRKGEGVPVNKQEAIKYYKMSIDKGYVGAMCNYANMLENGEGVPVNYEEAIKYYKMAIDKGDAYAMNNYALMLKNGEGVPVNYEEAIKYFKMAIEKGVSDAMLNYGNMLRKGEGVPVNHEEAIKYFKMADDKGHKYAKLFLALY